MSRPISAAFGKGSGHARGTLKPRRAVWKTLTGGLGERRLARSGGMRAPPVLVITAEYEPPREKDEFCAGKLRTAH